jgi:hypothetical protein
MFLFEVRPRLAVVPPPHAEGTFQFFPRASLNSLKIPDSDRECLWPWFWQNGSWKSPGGRSDCHHSDLTPPRSTRRSAPQQREGWRARTGSPPQQK